MSIFSRTLLKNKYLLIAILFSFLSIYSLFNPGLPPTHDGEYHVMRFNEFYKVLSTGTIYPRWAPDFNNGFGIPLFNYVYPLPNYVASFFHLLGFSFIDSFKLNMIAASLTGSVFFFLWSRRYWGQLGGLVSSVFYTFSPYHFLDIYVRGSVGEVWALALFPGLLWGFHTFIQTKQRKFLLISAVFLFLLIMSHNILAVVFFSFFFMYALLLLSETKNKVSYVKHFLLIVILGFSLSAPFWLPAILETKYVVGLNISDPTEHFPKLYQLIYSSWGYGFSGEDRAGQMSFQIGIANLIAVFGAILLVIRDKKKEIIFFLSSFVFFLFLITPFSSEIWESIPFSSFIQFPWRLLSILILISSFLAGSLVQKRPLVALFLIVLTVSLGIRYAKAPFHHLRNDNYYFTKCNFTDGTNSPGNAFNTIWFDKSLKKTGRRLTSETAEAKIEIFENRSTLVKANVDSNTKGKLLVNIAYFPGWKVYINDKEPKIKVNDKGLFEFDVPKGKSLVAIIFEDTNIRKFSALLSLISLFLMIGLFMKEKSIKIKK